MLRWSCVVLMAMVFPAGLATAPKDAAVSRPAAVTDGPGFTADGQLRFPADYREWVFLAAGLDMSYTADTGRPGMSMFNNVFVNPAAYREFKQTGLWPNGTVMVLENRGAEGAHSINKKGKTQTAEVMGVEVHARDPSRLKDGWGFYGFDNKVSAKEIAHTASCYSCHEQHAAVDTTFVQYYPTLMEIARAKGTLSKEYLKEESSGGGK